MICQIDCEPFLFAGDEKRASEGLKNGSENMHKYFEFLCGQFLKYSEGKSDLLRAFMDMGEVVETLVA